MKFPILQSRIHPSATEKINDVFQSGWVGEGRQVSNFESKLSNYFGRPVLTVNSGTSALSLAFERIAEKCHTVLTTPLTCFATTAAILKAGLKIEWVDIDPFSLNLSKEDLVAKHQPGKGVCLVHFAGRPCIFPFDENTPLVEDCAHAFGSVLPNFDHSYRCYSFQAVKTLTTCDGGAILTPQEDVYLIRLLRWYGMDRNLPRNQEIQQVGLKHHMNDVIASIGLANFDLSFENLKLQRSNCFYYSNNLPELSLKYCEASANWIFPIMVERKEDFIKKMKEFSIEADPIHYRNDKKICVAQYRTSLPGMDFVEKNMVCIPCGWWINQEAREYIVDCIKKGW